MYNVDIWKSILMASYHIWEKIKQVGPYWQGYLGHGIPVIFI